MIDHLTSIASNPSVSPKCLVSSMGQQNSILTSQCGTLLVWKVRDMSRRDFVRWQVNSAHVLCEDMQWMFFETVSFNGDLSKWDVSRVTNMHEAFGGATSFNSDLSNWQTSNVVDMEYLFYGATRYIRRDFLSLSVGVLSDSFLPLPSTWSTNLVSTLTSATGIYPASLSQTRCL